MQSMNEGKKPLIDGSFNPEESKSIFEDLDVTIQDASLLKDSIEK